jgi:argonaute-like protein implicated in RNA metabolism and viral defense
MTIDDLIERFDGSLAYSTNSKEICQYIADLLKELKERRRAPETIFCHECKHWKDSDGVYRRGISAESKCPVNSRQVYEGIFFCGMAERRTE